MICTPVSILHGKKSQSWKLKNFDGTPYLNWLGIKLFEGVPGKNKTVSAQIASDITPELRFIDWLID